MLKQRPDDPIVKDLVKYNVDHREVYDVINDFDESPNNLSDSKKTLRKKYLNIILSVMDDKNDMMKRTLTQKSSGPMFQGPIGGQGPMNGQGPMDGQGHDPKMREMFLLYGLGNYDPAFNTVKRIIKLLIMEIDLNGSIVTCPTCATQQPCPTCVTPPPCPTCASCPVCPICAVCPTCAVCPKCEDCNDNTYIGVIVALIIILVIMSIVLAMGSGGNAPMPI